MTIASTTTPSTTWKKASETVTSRRSIYDRQEEDPAAGVAYAEYSNSWDEMIRTPAPSIEAIAFKLKSLIERVHLEESDDSVSDLGFLQRLLDENRIDTGAPLIWILRDALRLAAIDDPILDLRTTA